MPAALINKLRLVLAILRCPFLASIPLEWPLSRFPDGITTSSYLDDLLVLLRKLQQG